MTRFFPRAAFLAVFAVLILLLISAFCLIESTLAATINPPGESFSKERTAEDLYGKAVHAFFAKDYAAAKTFLLETEKLGGDPRPCFFLGLTHWRLGEKDAAESAFKTAARLEWESRNARDYDVSGAIARIQGNERLMLEKYRQNAEKTAAEYARTHHEKVFGGTQLLDSRQTAARYSATTLRPNFPFVAAAPFGARSIDPFRKNYADEKDNLIEAKNVTILVKPVSLTNSNENNGDENNADNTSEKNTAPKSNNATKTTPKTPPKNDVKTNDDDDDIWD